MMVKIGNTELHATMVGEGLCVLVSRNDVMRTSNMYSHDAFNETDEKIFKCFDLLDLEENIDIDVIRYFFRSNTKSVNVE